MSFPIIITSVPQNLFSMLDYTSYESPAVIEQHKKSLMSALQQIGGCDDAYGDKQMPH